MDNRRSLKHKSVRFKIPDPVLVLFDRYENTTNANIKQDQLQSCVMRFRTCEKKQLATMNLCVRVISTCAIGMLYKDPEPLSCSNKVRASCSLLSALGMITITEIDLA